MKISQDIQYVGVYDHVVDLFEGQYPVPEGISYNSYVILDEKIAVMDTVDQNFTEEWLNNLQQTLGERQPDYLVVQHMEPDHSASIAVFLDRYPTAAVIASSLGFTIMKNYFGTDYADRRIIVKENDTLCLGRHTLTFLSASMIHWPEVIMSYDDCDKVFFSADAFGTFGHPQTIDEWTTEARRYYIGIVGKYGVQVQTLLQKAAALEICKICSLHGPVLSENPEHYLDLYDTWSSYRPEKRGILIAYTSIYGHTKAAVELLAEKLQNAVNPDNAEKLHDIETPYNTTKPEIVLRDLARSDMTAVVAEAFCYDRIVLATTTYNADIFPYMKEFLHHLTERNFSNRTVAFIENGSWVPIAGRIMRKMLEDCKDITYTENNVKILSALSEENYAQLDALARELLGENS